VPLITNNIITENYVKHIPYEEIGFGGGIYILNSSPLVIGNKRKNWAGSTDLWDFVGGSGGGIAIVGSSSAPIITENEIVDNSATTSAFCSALGGGIYAESSSPTISKNVIKNNNTDQYGATAEYTRGGGIYISGSISSVMITQNEIIGNQASAIYGTIEECSGIYMYNSAPSTIANNIIARNDIGGITLNATSAKIINNTIAQNEDNGIHIGSLSLPEIVNNIIYDNMGFGIYEDDTTIPIFRPP
jgi:parallel beta-helix repeat protein